jgi:hypothetical protein
MPTETPEAQEAMLTRDPVHVDLDDNTNGVVFLDEDLRFLIEAILDVRPCPRKQQARNVDGCRGDEVIPVIWSAGESTAVVAAEPTSS